MIEDRVGEVRLRLRTDLPDAAEIRPAAERIVRAALERCAALLEERRPGRIWFLRRMPLRWRADETSLDDPELIGELAREASDAIERVALPAALDVLPTNADAVWFEDEAHLRACHLLAIARRKPAWLYEQLEQEDFGEPLAALAMPQRRAAAVATLHRLAAANVLAEALTAQPPAAVAVLAAALGLDTPPRGPGTGLRAAAAIGPGSGRGLSRVHDIAELANLAAGWPALGRPAQALALRFHAAVLLDTDASSPGVAALVAAVSSGAAPPMVRIKPPGAEPEGAIPAPARDSWLDEPWAGTMAPKEPADFIATQCAGLFYLLDRVQELELAEALWRACLPEGAVLAAAAAALLGPGFADDPAPALFGGIEGAIACPEIDLDQHAEVAAATLTALAAALPRRGLAEIPAAIVALVEHSAGRQLVAAGDGSPFVLFAWPATTPAMVGAGLRVLLDAWPHSSPLSAGPALAALDSSGRLRRHADVRRGPLMLPAAASAPAAALLALVIGAPCALFAARAGTPQSDRAEAFVSRYLARPARIRVGPELIEVDLGGGEVDPAVRRAGLDRDPGWLRWLQRSLRFVFEDHETGVEPNNPG